MLRFNLLLSQTNQNKFLLNFTFIIIELEDDLLLVSILVLKRKIRRRLLIKPKKKRSILVKGIFKNTAVWRLPYFTLK